jgi:predicted ester cyclase
LGLIDELYSPQMAAGARRWIAPSRESFPDVQMEIAEDEKVVGRFRCSGTHLGEWRGNPPTGRRFERVDEVYIYRVHRNRPSSVSTTSTPRSASRPRKPAKSEPAWSGSA